MISLMFISLTCRRMCNRQSWPRPVRRNAGSVAFKTAKRALGRMERIKQQSDDGQVARVIDGLKPHRDRDEAVAACIDCFEANRSRIPATFAGIAGCRSDPASWKAPASRSSGAGSSGRGVAGRKRAPTPSSPPNAALKTTDGPTSLIGGLAASQPSDRRK